MIYLQKINNELDLHREFDRFNTTVILKRLMNKSQIPFDNINNMPNKFVTQNIIKQL